MSSKSGSRAVSRNKRATSGSSVRKKKKTAVGADGIAASSTPTIEEVVKSITIPPAFLRSLDNQYNGEGGAIFSLCALYTTIFSGIVNGMINVTFRENNKSTFEVETSGEDGKVDLGLADTPVGGISQQYAPSSYASKQTRTVSFAAHTSAVLHLDVVKDVVVSPSQSMSSQGHERGLTSSVSAAPYTNEVTSDKWRGYVLLSCSSDGSVKKWSLPDCGCLMSFVPSSLAQNAMRCKENNLQMISPAAVNCFCLSPCGSILYTGDDNGYLHVYNFSTGEEISSLRVHLGRVTGVVCPHVDGTSTMDLQSHKDLAPPKANCVITVSDDELGRLINPNSKSVHAIFICDRVPALCVAYRHPDVLIGGIDGTIRAFNIHTAQVSFQLRGHTDGINRLYIVPKACDSDTAQDNRVLVSVSDDRLIHCWDFKSWSPCLSITPESCKFAERAQHPPLAPEAGWDPTAGPSPVVKAAATSHLYASDDKCHSHNISCVAFDSEGTMHTGCFAGKIYSWDYVGMMRALMERQRIVSDATPKPKKPIDDNKRKGFRGAKGSSAKPRV